MILVTSRHDRTQLTYANPFFLFIRKYDKLVIEAFNISDMCVNYKLMINMCFPSNHFQIQSNLVEWG